ncbi:MAG: endonuclease/exonuclease/phosphatase family protein [Sneathiella sp.]|nr:endonuclease/exonuclease/phosphatase family protein [Sneathiella sp.]
MNFSIIIATLLLVILTLLPVWNNSHWLVRSMDFPRLQIAFYAVVLIVLQCFLVNTTEVKYGLIGITLACFIWQVLWILPYTRLWPVEVKSAEDSDSDSDSDSQLSILTANVLTPNQKAHKLIELVKQHRPDVLVTLESDQWWEDQLDILQADMPFTIKCPQDNLYGMHVYSRLPLEEHSIEYIVEDDIPSMHALLRLQNGDAVQIHFLHPAPPSPTENQESAERDAELVTVARRIAKSKHGPIILTGDLNDVAWSSTTRLFRKISGLLDPRVGRGMFNTFHASYPFLRWPLDHLFHSEHFTVKSILRLPPIGSDHFALLTRLSYSPIHGADQNGLESTGKDHARANKIIEEQKE